MAHLEQTLVNLYRASSQVRNEGAVTMQSTCGLGKGVQIPNAGCKLGENNGDPA